MTPRIQRMAAWQATLIAALVALGTFPPHLPSNYRIGCLTTAFVLWKILRLYVDKAR